MCDCLHPAVAAFFFASSDPVARFIRLRPLFYLHPPLPSWVLVPLGIHLTAAIAPSVTEGMQSEKRVGNSVFPGSIIEGAMHKRPRMRTTRINLSVRQRQRWFVLTDTALAYYEYSGNKVRTPPTHRC